MAREVYSPGSSFLKRGLDSDQSVKDRTMSDPPPPTKTAQLFREAGEMGFNGRGMLTDRVIVSRKRSA